MINLVCVCVCVCVCAHGEGVDTQKNQDIQVRDSFIHMPIYHLSTVSYACGCIAILADALDVPLCCNVECKTSVSLVFRERKHL